MPDIAAKAAPKPERFIKTAVVCHRLGDIDVTTLWRGVRDGHIPKPVKLHPTSRINLWRESEINTLMATRPPGGTWRPEAAIAANARRRANKKNGTAKVGFIRGTPRFHFVRRAPTT